MNVIGNGCVVHIDAFFEEIDKTEAKGVKTEGRIMLSDRCHIVFDLHQAIDGLKELELGNSKVGTTRKGIGPVYSSKASRGGIRVGDLLFDTWKERFAAMVKNKSRVCSFCDRVFIFIYFSIFFSVLKELILVLMLKLKSISIVVILTLVLLYFISYNLLFILIFL